MRNADMPAMPVRGADGEPITMRGDTPAMWGGEAMGLSKREVVAMHCAATLVGRFELDGGGMRKVAYAAVDMADELLAALEKIKTPDVLYKAGEQ